MKSKEKTTDEPKFKPNNDIGNCLRTVGNKTINRSKYKTEEDAQNQYNKLLSLGVVNINYVVYKCPACHTWHFGLREWSEK